VIEFIANTFDQNIRELEGALVRVVAWGDLTGQPITSELAEQALEDLLPQAEAEIPPDVILEESARYFGLSVQDLISPNRSRPLTTARHGILKVEKDMRARTATYRQVQDLSRIIRGRARAG
jgi:chromosomal replication initiator protein